jgi:nicotinate phosphoribosyltransferase
LRSREVLLKDRRRSRVVMQVFCKKKAILCGVPEVAELLRTCTFDPRAIRLRSLPEGSHVRPWETVMTIEGPYAAFAHLETLYLGILARRTLVASAVHRVVEAAGPKPVFFFAARFDHFLNQEGDGYAASVGGAAGMSTDAGASWMGGAGMGTVPHALIAAFGGDTVEACIAFDRYVADPVRRIALVDFENDCVKTSVEVAHVLGRKLWGVRLDTAEDMIDRSLQGYSKKLYGVGPELVWKVRRALNHHGYTWVKIVVSGGFGAEKVRDFRRGKVPFDAVGVGSYFFRERVDFTADIVRVDGRPLAKVGRRFRPNVRLRRMD